jgi:hypothetical protein
MHVIEFPGPTRTWAKTAIGINEINGFFARRLLTQYVGVKACNVASGDVAIFVISIENAYGDAMSEPAKTRPKVPEGESRFLKTRQMPPNEKGFVGYETIWESFQKEVEYKTPKKP